MSPSSRNSGGRNSRVSKNRFVTKSGATIKIRRSLTDRFRAHSDSKVRRKADRLTTLPKGRVKRFVAHFQPKRVVRYWFSREGAIMALKIIGIGTVMGCLLLLGTFAYFRKDLPNLKDISGDNIGGSTRYYDRTGKTLLWEDYDSVKRIPVNNDADIAQSVKDATVAVEDKDFFKHGGFDVRGILRAGFNDTFGHGGTQGGSTITQQLVKLTQDWTKDRTITRKIKELILAVELERSYSKQDILDGYLNTAPYGNVEYGVEAASRDYFHKSAKDLNLDEAAFLAAIPKSPAYYSPYGPYYNPNALRDRQHYILDLMAEQGKITTAQRDAAKKVDTIAAVQPRPANKYNGIKAPWFVLAAKAQLEAEKGSQTVKSGGWTVITTLDTNLQDLAEKQVQNGLPQVRRQGGDTAAFAAEDVKTGQMVALVGGADFSDPDHGQFNFATTPLPPGSSFKPYDYTALFETSTNAGAGSVLYDTQGPLEGYPCTNKAQPKQGGNCLWDYDFRYPGPITIRYALGGSRNVPAVKTMLTTGINKTIDIADKLMTSGVKQNGYKCYRPDLQDISNATQADEAPCYASSAIGDGAYLHLDEHVHGFASISRNGLNLPQTYILKFSDAKGKTLDEWKPSKGEQAVRPDGAYIVADMLSDPNASYFPAGRKPQRYTNKLGTWKFAMKTGTTNDGKDGWMMGFSTQYAAGVWVGYHTRQKVMSGTMENMTQPIWQGWMDAAHANLKPEDRQKPASVQSLPAFVITSHVGIGSVEPSPSNDLFPGWYTGNNKKATTAKKTIDVVSNKLATDCTPSLARKDTTEANANSFSIDNFNGNNNQSTNTTDTDDVHQCSDTKPTVTVTATDNKDGTFTLTATATAGTYPFSDPNRSQYPGTINFSVDGQVVKTFTDLSDSPSTRSFTYTPNGSGDHKVSAQVIDSVLYDASDSTTITVAAAQPPPGQTNQPAVVPNPGNGNGNH